MNPLQHLYDGCNKGTNKAKWTELPDSPRILDIELTSSCNFRCLMCPTGNLSLKRPAEFMDYDLFEAVCEQAEGAALRFIGWGEPTLHPRILDIVAKADSHGLLTHLNTNGSKIDGEFAKNLVKSGLKSIKFSFQGVDRKSYREMRNMDFFEEMLEAISVMKQAKRDGFPFIAASTTTTYESDEKIDAFRIMMSRLVDQLTVGKTIFDYMDLSAVRLRNRELLDKLRSLESVDKVHPNPCPEVFDKLSIHADGSVVLCCNDVNGDVELGNVREVPIKELWRHPKIEEYRRRLSMNDYSQHLCNTCFDYHKLTNGVENVPETLE